MTDKELQKLNRKELLEILVEQAGEIERLQEALKAAEEKAKSREIKVSEAGSIAEAALSLNGIFEAAQAAADQYLENIKNTEDICKQLCDDAKLQADQIVAEAEAKAAAAEENSKMVSEKYWDDVSQRLERFYDEHQGLRELLKMNILGN